MVLLGFFGGCRVMFEAPGAFLGGLKTSSQKIKNHDRVETSCWYSSP